MAVVMRRIVVIGLGGNFYEVHLPHVAKHFISISSSSTCNAIKLIHLNFYFIHEEAERPKSQLSTVSIRICLCLTAESLHLTFILCCYRK